MELAAMEGSPTTLQEVLENAKDDLKLNEFLELEQKMLIILKNRVYSNTLRSSPIAPFRHYLLHISDQVSYLERNLKNLARHKAPGMIVSEQITINLFNTIRKNNDSISSDQCIGHGDLNFANIILDEQKNIWTIDWTHASYHPLEIDFAKMENDIKFIISKEITIDDLGKLQLMEEFMLDKLGLPDLDKLPSHLKFISWDIRFKKIYLPVKQLRDSYLSIKKNKDWLVYKISLIRYSLHTLSFDKTMDRGECSPAQLWYAYISSEAMLFQLMADDYHLKIRSEKPDNYPDRFRIQIDQANWKVDCPNYNPPAYSEENVIEFADPLNKWDFEDAITWGRHYERNPENNIPLNPVGRTGISGRGSLPFWGSNPIMALIPFRYDPGTKHFFYLKNRNENTIEFINTFYARDDNDELVSNRLASLLPSSLQNYEHNLLHKGYLYHPRETDNAWIDAWVDMIYIDDVVKFETNEKEKFEWKELDYHDVNTMSSGSSNLIRTSIQHILDHHEPDNQYLMEVLRKTG
jgi:ADP-ribose pyrophosphatase